MLAASSHPTSTAASSSSSRGPVRSASSSSSAFSTRPTVARSASSTRPLQTIQAPQTMRDPLVTVAGGGIEKRSINSLAKQQQQPISPVEEQQQPPQAVVVEKKEEKKKDRSKLTEQWGSPPEQIRRDHEWLQRGQLLGEGGFARVYLCTEPDGVTTKALKVIDKQQLKSTKTKAKLFAEIKIHQSMDHPNIIAFEHCFEDEGNVYMQLELCGQGSLLDLLRRRRRYSEPEARYYLTQLVGACDYMHGNSVIHRDLKLGNLMLDDRMDLRVGDFGLAALVKFPGERKKTICGTPNYIAPEILFDTKGGHSFEVDIWSIGVILYTLLIGKPPFQTKDVKNIYRKIRDNVYEFPKEIPLSPEAEDLITWILRPIPSERPTLSEILAHPFLVTGPFPSRISPRCADSEGARSCIEEWRYMTKRQARENFETVKRNAGIVEIVVDSREEAAGGVRAPVQSALEAVAEAVEERPTTSSSATGSREGSVEIGEEEKERERRRRMVRVRGGTAEEREAKGRVEKEVMAATAPESPISELLRSARKPLMVSPSASNQHPRRQNSTEQTLQRRLAAASASSNGIVSASSSSSQGVPPQQPTFQRTSSTSSSVPRSRSITPPTTAATSSTNIAASSMTTDPGTPRSRHRRAAAQAQLDLAGAPSSSSSTISSKTTTTPPSRTLYESIYRSFDSYLSVTSASQLPPLLLEEEKESVEPPKVFITSWVDYTHKYGTAYSLTDGTAGLYFNDSTTMVLSPDKEHFDYISQRKSNLYTRKHHNLTLIPPELDRKAYLLRYFEDYMAKTLRRDVSWTFEDVERKKNMEFLVKYYRMKNAIVFKMSNDLLQFNFYDHTKLIITNSGQTLTFIDPSFTLSTYSLSQLFHLAAQLGHYSSSTVASAGEVAKLERVRYLVGKVEYCRDVLRTLSQRRATQQQGATKENQGVKEEGGN
ncbi:CDC5/polo family serine/threonine-protein kinase [Sporobolomyces salmoneus]|uniref:CDC5/polo family serine/threonine-protein kinase n=1 Tax=Sporobolomyces salmoneus TaxID=183962 RepID=UPI00317AF8F4